MFAPLLTLDNNFLSVLSVYLPPRNKRRRQQTDLLNKIYINRMKNISTNKTLCSFYIVKLRHVTFDEEKQQKRKKKKKHKKEVSPKSISV